MGWDGMVSLEHSQHQSFVFHGLNALFVRLNHCGARPLGLDGFGQSLRSPPCWSARQLIWITLLTTSLLNPPPYLNTPQKIDLQPKFNSFVPCNHFWVLSHANTETKHWASAICISAWELQYGGPISGKRGRRKDWHVDQGKHSIASCQLCLPARFKNSAEHAYKKDDSLPG